MAQNTKLGSGTTLDLTIPLPVPISEIHNVECEFYTDPNKPFKFSYLEKTGYSKLNEGANPAQLVGKILSTDTAKMKGCLFMRISLIKDAESATEDIGRSIPTSTTITFI